MGEGEAVFVYEYQGEERMVNLMVFAFVLVGKGCQV